MKIEMLALVLTAAAMLGGMPAAAQPQCGSPSPEQQQRRRIAIMFVRAFNTAQHRYHQQQKRWADLTELTASEGWTALAKGPFGTLPVVTPNAPEGEIMPGFQATTVISSQGYALVVRDKQDPCGQTFTTTHNGLIFVGAPLQ